MVEVEADDALATAAARWMDEADVEQIVICTPDKDMAQCVRDARIVCLDRMRRKLIDEMAVIEKYGVPPHSIPDWLALVGDSSDGYPGIARWGAKSAAAVLARYGHLEAIPDHEREWGLALRGASTLAASLRDHRDEAYLYRRLATLRTDAPLDETLDDLRWRGARRADLTELCHELGNQDSLNEFRCGAMSNRARWTASRPFQEKDRLADRRNPIIMRHTQLSDSGRPRSPVVATRAAEQKWRRSCCLVTLNSDGVIIEAGRRDQK